MNDFPVDYRRYARQISLAEVGPEGQHKLSCHPVFFQGADCETVALAQELYLRAGGALSHRADLAATVRVPEANNPCASVGLAAWAAIEAARGVLCTGDQVPVGQPPEGLIAALSVAADEK